MEKWTDQDLVLVVLLFFVFGKHVGSQLPDQTLNLCPLHWKWRVLTTGPRGKSQDVFCN